MNYSVSFTFVSEKSHCFTMCGSAHVPKHTNPLRAVHPWMELRAFILPALGIQEHRKKAHIYQSKY